MRPLPNMMITMKIKFKPMPGLTIAVLICLGILLTLGTWQYRRLQWKTALLEQIDQAAHGAPFRSLSDINARLAQGVPVDFRRVSLRVNFISPPVNDGTPFHLNRSNGKSFSWRLYQPVMDGDILAYVATREFTDTQKENPPARIDGQKDIIGYVRLVQVPNWTLPQSNPETNRWFAFDAAPELLDWSYNKTIETAYYIDHVEHVGEVENLPVLMPEIANNHLDYMLTWYSFVFILLVIYALVHRKQGRLWIERD